MKVGLIIFVAYFHSQGVVLRRRYNSVDDGTSKWLDSLTRNRSALGEL